MRFARPGAKRAPRHALVLILAATLAVTGLPFFSVARAEAACTRWTSRLYPPPSVRVLRTATGRVQTVDFRYYVNVVLAAEMPSYYPMETLKANAVAVKQYAWYHVLHHRSWYVTGSGVCYDVKDSTADQVYNPARYVPTDRQKYAVSKTWPVSIRKYTKFIMTGYRAGSWVRCGADRNGWLLYQHSAYDCGKRGYTRKQILSLYYGPGYSEVWP